MYSRLFIIPCTRSTPGVSVRRPPGRTARSFKATVSVSTSVQLCEWRGLNFCILRMIIQFDRINRIERMLFLHLFISSMPFQKFSAFIVYPKRIHKEFIHFPDLFFCCFFDKAPLPLSEVFFCGSWRSVLSRRSQAPAGSCSLCPHSPAYGNHFPLW